MRASTSAPWESTCNYSFFVSMPVKAVKPNTCMFTKQSHPHGLLLAWVSKLQYMWNLILVTFSTFSRNYDNICSLYDHLRGLIADPMWINERSIMPVTTDYDGCTFGPVCLQGPSIFSFNLWDIWPAVSRHQHLTTTVCYKNWEICVYSSHRSVMRLYDLIWYTLNRAKISLT